MTDTALRMSLGKSAASKGLEEKNGMHQVKKWWEGIKARNGSGYELHGPLCNGLLGPYADHRGKVPILACISHSLPGLLFLIGIKTLCKKLRFLNK